MLHGIKTYYVVYFQTPGNGPTSPEDWIQFSVCLGGMQSGSNLMHIFHTYSSMKLLLQISTFSLFNKTERYTTGVIDMTGWDSVPQTYL